MKPRPLTQNSMWDFCAATGEKTKLRVAFGQELLPTMREILTQVSPRGWLENTLPERGFVYCQVYLFLAQQFEAPYSTYRVGDKIELTVHAGRFGLRWYERFAP